MIVENGRMLAECIYPQEDHTETALLDLDLITHDRLHQSTYVNETDSYTFIPVSMSPSRNRYHM